MGGVAGVPHVAGQHLPQQADAEPPAAAAAIGIHKAALYRLGTVHVFFIGTGKAKVGDLGQDLKFTVIQIFQPLAQQ